MFSRAAQLVISKANQRQGINTTVKAGSVLHGRMPDNQERIVALCTNLKYNVTLFREWNKLPLSSTSILIIRKMLEVIYMPWKCIFLSLQSTRKKKNSFRTSLLTLGHWITGVTQLQNTVKFQVDLCIFITCDGRKWSGVGMSQQHIFFIRLRQVGVAAELLFLGQLERDRDQTKLDSSSAYSHSIILSLLPSKFLLCNLMIYLPLKPILTRLQSRVFVLSLSSEMKIMLLLFFFFLLFLSLTSASPTVTTRSSTVLALMLPLECWRFKGVGDSGGRSLGGGKEGSQYFIKRFKCWVFHGKYMFDLGCMLNWLYWWPF